MLVRKLVIGLGLLVQGAASAQATVSQTLEFGSAVESYDRHARFDSLIYDVPLAGYAEDGLKIERSGNCYCVRNHHKAGFEPTTISAADGQEWVALELEAGRSSELGWTTILTREGEQLLPRHLAQRRSASAVEGRLQGRPRGLRRTLAAAGPEKLPDGLPGSLETRRRIG
jgi:hypothetical protein